MNYQPIQNQTPFLRKDRSLTHTIITALLQRPTDRDIDSLRIHWQIAAYEKL